MTSEDEKYNAHLADYIVRMNNLLCQKLWLQIDFVHKLIKGVTELTVNISNQTESLRELRLNARRLHIARVFVNDVTAEFNHDDPVEVIRSDSMPNPLSHHPEIRRCYLDGLDKGDKGELCVKIPDVVLENDMRSSTNGFNEGATADTVSNQNSATLRIRVDYWIKSPDCGFHFVFSDPDALMRFPHIYTDNQSSCARFWLPCFDRPQERCPWEIEITVPRAVDDIFPPDYVESVKSAERDDLDDEDDESVVEDPVSVEMMALASGELVEHYIDPLDQRKKIFKYVVDVATPASGIHIAVGPFEVFDLSDLSESPPSNDRKADGLVPDEEDAEDDDAVQKDQMEVDSEPSQKCLAFYLPGFREEVILTVRFIMQAWLFFEHFAGVSFPFSSFKLVFMENLYSPLMCGSGISFISKEIIDQVYDSRRLICQALASQWFGQLIFNRTRQDEWLIVGLTNYMVALFLKKIFGNNEYRFRLNRDIKRVCEMDVNQPPLYPVTQPPLGEQNVLLIDPLLQKLFSIQDEWSSSRAEFVSLKAPLVLYMLDRRMGKGALKNAIGRITVAALSGGLQNGLSTQNFLKFCRKVSETFDPRQFAEQWIYSSGCPKFTITHRFNRKKMMIEIIIQQENTNADNVGACKKFTGPFMIQVHEPRGVTYDTAITIDEMERQYEILYHTKYKRAGQKLKKLKKLAGEAAAAHGADEDDDDQNDIFEKEDNSKGPDLDQFDRRSLDWIRFDPHFDWVCIKSFVQLRSMWIDQVTRDIDVFAQHEAIEALGCIPTDVSTNALHRVLQDARYFYRLRMLAAFSLAKCADEKKGGGLQYLISYYNELYCFPSSPDAPMTVPRPNNFSDFMDYFIKQTIPRAISTVRDQDGNVPIKCKQMLLDLLKYNSNIDNEYSDNFFISSLITALGNAFIPCSDKVGERRSDTRARTTARDMDGLIEVFDTSEVPYNGDQLNEASTALELAPSSEADRLLLLEADLEVERYLMLDRLVASYHNSITVSCLEVFLKWMLIGLKAVDLSLFHLYSRQGHFTTIRMIAIDALVLLNRFQNIEITAHLLILAATDESPQIRYHVAKALCNCAIILTSSMRLGVNNGPYHPSTNWNEVKSNLVKNESFSDLLFRLVNREIMDYRVRSQLLRLCEYLYDAVPEASVEAPSSVKAKIVIKVPSLPTADASADGFDNDQAPSTAPDLQAMPQPADPVPQSQVEIVPPVSANNFAVPALKKIKIALPKPISDNSMQAAVSHDQPVKILEAATGDRPVPVKSLPVDPKFLSVASTVLLRMRSHSLSGPFLVPVHDSIAPGYSRIITSPMDLSTALKKLQDGLYYNNLENLYSDMRLMFNNCRRFNGPESIIAKHALQLESYLSDVVAREASQLNGAVLTETVALSTKNATNDGGVEGGGEDSRVPRVIVEEPMTTQEPGMPQELYKKCKRIIKKFIALPEAAWFLQPVDPVALNLPKYLDIIKRPMDFSTLASKLKAGKYKTLDEFASRARRIFKNAMTYNNPITQVHQDAAKLLSLLESELQALEGLGSPATSVPKIHDINVDSVQLPLKKIKLKDEALSSSRPSLAVAPKISLKPAVTSTAVEISRMTQADTKKCSRILKKLQNDKFGSLFLKPVDPVALNIPQYLTVIKHPMDLSTIQRKLEADTYKSPSEFRQDVELMLNNCFTFNTPGDWVTAQGKGLEKVFGSEWAIVFEGAKVVEASLFTNIDAPIYEILVEIITNLRNQPDAILFLSPVNLTLYPDYAIKIQRPMDLGTMQQKLDAGLYPDLSALESDFRLMITNCHTYNAKTTAAHKAASSLEKFFSKMVSELISKRKV